MGVLRGTPRNVSTDIHRDTVGEGGDVWVCRGVLCQGTQVQTYIEVQWVRVETCGCAKGYAKEREYRHT